MGGIGGTFRHYLKNLGIASTLGSVLCATSQIGEPGVTVSLTIRQTLASRVLDGKVRTFPIVDAKGDPVGITEVKLREIAVKPPLFAVLI